jgi:hypothetical protein
MGRRQGRKAGPRQCPAGTVKILVGRHLAAFHAAQQRGDDSFVASKGLANSSVTSICQSRPGCNLPSRLWSSCPAVIVASFQAACLSGNSSPTESNSARSWKMLKEYLGMKDTRIKRMRT